MKRANLAGLAVFFIAGGILAIVTSSAMRRNVIEPATISKTWQEPDDSWKQEKLLKDYQLTERSGKLIGTQELAGQVHVASFFFASCPGSCTSQNKTLETLKDQFKGKPVKFLSISCDPGTDTPAVLKEYAKRFTAEGDQWYFLRGDLDYVRRIGGEIYQVHVAQKEHVDRFIVVDKWGKVRGSFDWKDSAKFAECKWLIDKLLLEEMPPEPTAEPATSAPAQRGATDDDVKPTEKQEATTEATTEKP